MTQYFISIQDGVEVRRPVLYFESFHLYEDAIHVTEQLDWHNNPPSEFFADIEREHYAMEWLKRLQLCGLLGDRQNYLRVVKAVLSW